MSCIVTNNNKDMHKNYCIIINYGSFKTKWNTAAVLIVGYLLNKSACSMLCIHNVFIKAYMNFIKTWLMQWHARFLVWTGHMLSAWTWSPIDLERWKHTFLFEVILKFWRRDKQHLCIICCLVTFPAKSILHCKRYCSFNSKGL